MLLDIPAEIWNNDLMKTCSKCKAVKSLEDFYLYRKSRASSKKYYQAHCKICDHIRHKKYRKNNTEKLKTQMLVRHRFRLYGISEEEYRNMILSQNNLCAICNEPSIKTLHIDHSHETGKVRGLLCNTVIRG